MVLIKWIHKLLASITGVLWRARAAEETSGKLPEPPTQNSEPADHESDSDGATAEPKTPTTVPICGEETDDEEAERRDDRMSTDLAEELDDALPTGSTSSTSHRERFAVGYESALDYLHDELARAALLVKAYVIRRSAAEEADRSPLDLVTEVPFRWDNIPTESEWCRPWHDHFREASELQQHISDRLQRTPLEVARRFPLTRLWHDLTHESRSTFPEEKKRPRLSSLQRDVLLIAFLDYHFSAYRSAFRRLSTDDGTTPGGLSVGMMAEICQPTPKPGDDPLALFQTDVPLLRDRYVLVGDAGIETSRRRLQIDPAIVSFLLETGEDDAELQGLVTRYKAPLLWDELLADESTLKLLRGLSKRTPLGTVVLFHGPAGGPYVSAARAVLSASSRPSLLVADVARAASLPNWTEWTARVYRLARLHDSAVLWDGATAIIEAHRTDARWRQFLRPRPNVPVFISSDAAWDPDGTSSRRVATFARIEFPVPSREVRLRSWRQHLESENIPLPPSEIGVTLELLASFQFTEGQIADAIMIARGLALTDDSTVPDMAGHLYDACRRVSARGLVSFTQRIPPRKFGPDKNPLDAVILAPEGQQQLQELNDRIENMNRVYYEYGFGTSLCLGRGLIALFSGPSGTGKTLAATVLASCRERDLYKVDMSAVVSKYVGETEKNLARVFSDAQSSNALLFFDEADAIFGKRGEIDKAQDRWANMEINYLLQRVEEFSGVVILATNLKQNIDDAFLRRVQVLIDFKTPDARDRQKILAAMFPADVISPGADDLKAFCEQFELTGGNLKNVAVDAAFRALHEQRLNEQSNSHRNLQIRIEHLVLAAAREYRKLSRPVSLASFGRRFYEMVKAALKLD